MTLLLLALFALLALVLLSGDWRGGLLLTLVIGFLQDPIRKLTPGQPGLYVGLVLIAFLGTAVVLLQKRRGRLELPAMFWSAPALTRWVPLFVLLIALQAANGLVRSGVPLRTVVGVGFYLAPLLGLWMGFQLGREQPFLRRVLQVYLLGSALVAITVFLDYQGVDIPLFREVGGGILIHFRYGFYTYGASGLWRTSELAAWHLSASAALALVMASAARQAQSRNGWLLLAGAFALLTLSTGRRKGIVFVAVFVAVFLWLLARNAPGRSAGRLLTTLVSAGGLALVLVFLLPETILGDDFGEYVSRAASVREDLLERFNVLGLRGFLRGVEISGGLGLGAGALAQTGELQLGVGGGEGAAFVSESGAGKLAAELGIPGLLILAVLGLELLRALVRNLALMRRLPTATANLELGLMAFALAQLPFFAAAAGVYGDPFVLLLCGLSIGSVFAVPSLLAQQAARQRPVLVVPEEAPRLAAPLGRAP
ncbi:hypothetical protein [Cyanobium sp. CH-040]|uniref:hypothetical protein n=1 Tax=Cyanobium sp. CH-040 TaxID=2823708 RepID=UPI0020CEA42C|nr:hypothetical protein [Cyanobium sp. CH-040]MCP9927893.1 hypothetical protein [Cyanobium sp. CH-040]